MAKLLKPTNTKPSVPCAPHWPITIRLHTSGATNTSPRAANKTRALVLIGPICSNARVGLRQNFPALDATERPTIQACTFHNT